MVKNIHVRLEYEEAVGGRKELLSSQMNVLQLMQKIKNYKIFRKRELILKGKLKKQFSELKHHLTEIHHFFPEDKTEQESEIRIKNKNIDEKHNKDIEYELQEIKEKLERLS